MNQARPSHLPGLDGLRGIAVLLVFAFHERLLVGFGWVGVQLFFVLSGFLITRILVAQSDQPAKPFFINFYGRRALRIFPLYYATLLALTALTLTWQLLRSGTSQTAAQTLEQLPWAWLYAMNFLHVQQGFAHDHVLTHFWSLAVEEQFYLVWPMLIFAIPRKWLVPMLVAVVAAGPVLRAMTWSLAAACSLNPDDAALVLPWCQLDAFAVGGLFAVQPVSNSKRCIPWALLAVAMIGLGTNPSPRWWWIGLDGMPVGLVQLTIGLSALNALCALIVSAVAFEGLGASTLQDRRLVQVGGISYGVYVFHFPIQAATELAAPHMSLLLKLPLDLMLTLAVSAASYRWLEAPALGLKSRLFGSAKAAAVAKTAGASPGQAR